MKDETNQNLRYIMIPIEMKRGTRCSKWTKLRLFLSLNDIFWTLFYYLIYLILSFC